MMFLNCQKPGLIKDPYIYKPDSIMLDLEDAVAENQKDAARYSLFHALQEIDYHGVERVVRINGLDTPHWKEDIRVCVAGGADTIRIAKTETAQDVRTVEEHVLAAEREFGRPEGSTLLMAALESCKGVLNALEVCQSSDRLIGIALSGLCYWINIDIAPRAKQSISELLIKAASINPKGLLNEGQAITKFDNLEIYIDKRVDDVIHGMHIYQKADEKSPSVAMHSERVTMDFSPEKKILTLNLINPLITTQEEGSISQSVTMDEMPLSINLDKSRSRRIKANRFTNREIREALDTPGYLDKKQTTEFATELPRRASFSLACIVFALIGVPLAINTRRKDTSTGFALGILIASLYFLALIFADLSRKNDTMLPYILLWLPNIITVAVALHLHKRARHKG